MSVKPVSADMTGYRPQVLKSSEKVGLYTAMDLRSLCSTGGGILRIFCAGILGKKFEIHQVFPHFLPFIPTQNLSQSALAA